MMLAMHCKVIKTIIIDVKSH